MKRFIVILITLFLFLSQTRAIFGQDIVSMQNNLPGISCGVAGDTTGKDKCCVVQPVLQCDNPVLNGIGGFLHYIPGVNGFSDGYLKGCSEVATYLKQNNSNPCVVGDASTSNYADPSCKCVSPNTQQPNVNTAMAEMCYKYLGSSSKSGELSSCLSCSSGNGMWTGFGCLPLDIKALISSFFLTTAIGIGGGLALLCIIYAAFTMQTSQGNPEKLKKAQEMITSCIMGLMLIIFSVFILKIIGVNILGIPGFG